jgi:hypothetical protein
VLGPSATLRFGPATGAPIRNATAARRLGRQSILTNTKTLAGPVISLPRPSAVRAAVAICPQTRFAVSRTASGSVRNMPIKSTRITAGIIQVLLGWKAAHEFRIAREHGAMLHPFGWIESLHIIDAPVFKPDQRIAFASLNVIVGKNGVGKTTICEWLWSLKDSSILWRWGAYPQGSGRKYHGVKVAIDFRAPARHHLEMEISGGELVTCWRERKISNACGH